MKKCRHPPDHVVIKYDIDGLPDPLELSWRECLDCVAWLPLGASNDDDERVDIEIEAARLAAMPKVSIEQWPSEMIGQEPHGWLGRKHDDDPIEPHYTYWAGWLARAIATHEDPC